MKYESAPVRRFLLLFVLQLSAAVSTADSVSSRKMGDGAVYGRLRFPSRSGSDGKNFIFLWDGKERLKLVAGDDFAGIHERKQGSWRRKKRIVFCEPPEWVYFSRHGSVIRFYLDTDMFCVCSCPGDGAVLSVGHDTASIPPSVHHHAILPVSMSDDFMRRRIGRTDSWKGVSGWWRQVSDREARGSPNPFICRGSAGGDGGVFLTGHVFWNHLEISAAVNPRDCAESGIVFGFVDACNYTKVCLVDGRAGSIRISRVRDGKEKVAALRKVRYPRGRWSRLSVRFAQGKGITAMLDGVKFLSISEEWNYHGKTGLFVAGGTAEFDDFEAFTLNPARKDEMPLIRTASRILDNVPEIRKNPSGKGNDELLEWAEGSALWKSAAEKRGSVVFTGGSLMLPLFGDFIISTPECEAPRFFQLGPWSGQASYCWTADPGKGSVIVRRDGRLVVDGNAVESGSGKSPLRIFSGYPAILESVPSISGTPLISELRSRNIRCEMFEKAPVDWMPVSGEWRNAHRWKCDPRWSFFSGVSYDDAILVSRSRYTGDQVHQLYFSMKDVIGRHYELRRYIRRDAGFSFCMDGWDLFSGYTVILGGFGNSGSYLYRGRKRIAVNRKVKFKRFTHRYSIYDEHLYWRVLRVERMADRIRVYYENKMIFDVVEDSDNRPSGGHVALWTCRNGLMFGRLNSSAEKIENASEKYFASGSSAVLRRRGWKPLCPERVEVAPERRGIYRVRNRFSGGTFAVEWPLNNTMNAVDLSEKRVLSLWMKIPAGVKINLHCRVNGRYFIYPVTAPVEKTYRNLCNPAGEWGCAEPEWAPFTQDPLDGEVFTGRPRSAFTGHFSINIYEDMKRRFPDAPELALDRIIVGNSSHADYLMTGLSGNGAGSEYFLGSIRE